MAAQGAPPVPEAAAGEPKNAIQPTAVVAREAEAARQDAAAREVAREAAEKLLAVERKEARVAEEQSVKKKKHDETGWAGRGEKGTGWGSAQPRKGSDDRTCRSCTFKDPKSDWTTAGRCERCEGYMCSGCTEEAEIHYNSMCSVCLLELDAAHDQGQDAAGVRLHTVSRCRACGCVFGQPEPPIVRQYPGRPELSIRRATVHVQVPATPLNPSSRKRKVSAPTFPALLGYIVQASLFALVRQSCQLADNLSSQSCLFLPRVDG